MTEPVHMSKEIHQAVDAWLENVVIGLNLCPFAAIPFRENRYRIFVSNARDEEQVLADLYQLCVELEETEVQQLETSLLVLPEVFADFYDFNQYLNLVDALLEQNNWLGVFQVATFHPQYQFADTAVDDKENLTNRSPYPILHILREASVSYAVDSYDDVNIIPARNIDAMQKLSDAEIKQYFPYLSKQ